MQTTRLLCALLLFCSGACSTAQTVAAVPAEIPIASFFRRPAVAAPKLSPDGSRIAARVPGPNGRMVLATANVATPSKRVGVAHFDDADVRSFQWVNDQRLVFDVIDFKSAAGEQFGGGLYAVDVDGENFVWLVGRGLEQESGGHMSGSHIANRPLRATHRLFSTLRDGSGDVIVSRFNFDRAENFGSVSLLRLNTETRATRKLVVDEPDHAAGWVLDRKGVPRAVETIDTDGNVKVLWRESPAAPWVEIGRYSLFDPEAKKFNPVAFEADGRLLVRAVRDDAARTWALFRFDLANKRVEPQPVLGLQGFDYNGEVIFERTGGQTLGASFVSDAPGVAWLHPDMQALQERVDKLLPNTANLILCGACLTQPRAIVVALSDRQSELFFVLDREKAGKDALVLLGQSRPWIDARLMAERDFIRIQARDGVSFPVYVTKPRGKGPWPTVVLVHGGPWVRGSQWGWDADAQFLASRGYLVVEPEFRGSTGYGDTLFRAGLKQWGLTMQDDVTDATKWAIAQGLADPKRVAIAGASYGGYATMMGLVKEPDLYRAGINWVGVTDIDLMYSIDWSDMGDIWQRYGMPRMVGDRTKDKAQLARTSPLKRAAEITKPVLMAYGSKDFRVPLPHGTEMRDALKAAGKVEVEWVEYEDEGHGWLLEKNNVDFWGRVERFLARHLR